MLASEICNEIKDIYIYTYTQISGWSFQTCFLFSIIWMDNPSHWLSYVSRWLKRPSRYHYIRWRSFQNMYDVLWCHPKCYRHQPSPKIIFIQLSKPISKKDTYPQYSKNRCPTFQTSFYHIPSGKLTFCYGKSTIINGKIPISMANFNSKLSVITGG